MAVVRTKRRVYHNSTFYGQGVRIEDYPDDQVESGLKNGSIELLTAANEQPGEPVTEPPAAPTPPSEQVGQKAEEKPAPPSQPPSKTTSRRRRADEQARAEE